MSFFNVSTVGMQNIFDNSLYDLGDAWNKDKATDLSWADQRRPYEERLDIFIWVLKNLKALPDK